MFGYNIVLIYFKNLKFHVSGNKEYSSACKLYSLILGTIPYTKKYENGKSQGNVFGKKF